MPATPEAIKSQMIPAIRQIGSKGSISDAFDGTGIIERVAKLQNPDVHNQTCRHRFNAIRDFLRDVVDRPEATIEVPYERDTILLHMDDKVLPIESLGSGIHEVIILASATTVLQNCVVCIEEPELHLNPILQKKLLRYLDQYTHNQYFITTHSVRWVPFTGQFQPLTSLTSGGRNRVRSQYRPHGEFCLPGSCGVLHGNTSRGSVPG
jgi:hypothetical protein